MRVVGYCTRVGQCLAAHTGGNGHIARQTGAAVIRLAGVQGHRLGVDGQIRRGVADVVIAVVGVGDATLLDLVGTTEHRFATSPGQRTTDGFATKYAAPTALNFGDKSQRRVYVAIGLALGIRCYRNRSAGDAVRVVVRNKADVVIGRLAAAAQL